MLLCSRYNKEGGGLYARWWFSMLRWQGVQNTHKIDDNHMWRAPIIMQLKREFGMQFIIIIIINANRGTI